MVANNGPSADRVLVACVAENRPPYSLETIYLFASLSAFGGRLADAQKIAYFVESVDGLIAEELAQLGVVVKVVERFSDAFPHANKIRMLDDTEDCEYLVALDTDVVIARDFADMVTGSAIRAKPVDDDPMTLEGWRQMFEYFGLRIPQARFLTTFSLKETTTYFNSGVLLIPRAHIHSLRKSWESFVHRLGEAYDELPALSSHRFFTDQFALTLALAETGLSFLPLPIEMNFPTHHSIHPAHRPDEIDPYVIHHHHRTTDTGELLACGYKKPDRRIATINAMKASRSEQMRRNRRKPGGISDAAQFWEKRYRDNPVLGSGVGSRGECLLYKRRILQSIIDRYVPSSILDVGCGDIEVVKDLNLMGVRYFGTDLSGSVIQQNRLKKPEWVFAEGDIRTLPDDFSAELVVGFDVLIHAPAFEDYESLLKELLRRTTEVCLISAYQGRPRDRFLSDITAYYEPITSTLHRLDAGNVQIVGGYRDTSIVLVEKSTAKD